MKTKSILLMFMFYLLFLSYTPPIHAEHVTGARAKTVAKNAYFERTNLKGGQTINLPQDITISSIITDNYSSSQVNFYIANVQNGGFIIIAGDDNVKPVIGYSFENNFEYSDLPPQLEALLEGYRQEMKDLYTNPSITVTQDVSDEWKKYETGTSITATDLTAVAPLMSSLWAQGCGFNALCPSDASGPCSRALVGCVAVAMGQVMYYHQYPQTGSGSHSYTHSVYGTLSANFGSTTYQWASMSDNSGNTASATLLYHCGVSVDMDYGPSASGIPVSSLYKVANAFTNYFRYSDDAAILYKSNYSSTAWDNMVKSEIDNGRPLFYVGTGTGGHAFNIDGYQGTNYFHLNWGWSGSYNGYFYLNDLTPGSYNFNSSQAAAFYVEPASNCPENLSISANISGSTVEYLASSTISANNVISNNANVHYGANTRVTLSNGFRVDAGCSFRANLSGCSLNKKGTMYEEESISFNNRDSKEINVFPNPAKSKVTLDLSDLEGEKQILIYSSSGQLVYENFAESPEVNIELNDFRSGLYVIKVLHNGENYQQRLVVE